MKSSKKLMIVLLVLAIVTAMSAGTLAIYTTTLDQATTTTVTAKSFVFTKGETFQDKTAIKLAPGENTAWDANGARTVNYSLINYDGSIVSEVPMSVAVKPIFDADLFDVYPGLQVTLRYREVAGEQIESSITWTQDNQGELELNGVFAANEANGIDCRLDFYWPNRDASDNASIDKSSAMSLAFTATQDVTASPEV